MNGLRSCLLSCFISIVIKIADLHFRLQIPDWLRRNKKQHLQVPACGWECVASLILRAESSHRNDIVEDRSSVVNRTPREMQPKCWTEREGSELMGGGEHPLQHAF